MKFAVANLAAKTSTALDHPGKIILQYPSQAEAGGNEGSREFSTWAPLDLHLSLTLCPERPGHGSPGNWSVLFPSQMSDCSVRQEESLERCLKLPGLPRGFINFLCGFSSLAENHTSLPPA